MSGVDRVEREDDRENTLCCSGAIAQFDAERAVALRARNLDDAQAAEVDALAELLGHAPPSLMSLAGRLPTPPNPLSNLVCTNVPGPMVPLYCIGHRMLTHYPLAPLSWNMGLNAGVLSYDQKLCFGLLAHAQAVPDAQRLASMLDEAFAELRYAAGVSPSDIPRMGEPTVAPERDGRRPRAAKRRQAVVARGKGGGASAATGPDGQQSATGADQP